jgi:hypothetical protein
MRSPLVSLLKVLCLLAALSTLALAATAPDAAAQECKLLMEDGTERDCTFTEKYGQCLFWAYDSYKSCSEPGDGWAIQAMCEIALEVDLLACTLAMIGDGIGLLTPF